MISKGARLRVHQPRHPRTADDAQNEVLDLYRRLGRKYETPVLRPGPWDLHVDDMRVELDEQLHFNRHRASRADRNNENLVAAQADSGGVGPFQQRAAQNLLGGAFFTDFYAMVARPQFWQRLQSVRHL